MKTCCRCKQHKPLDAFRKRGDRSGYVNSWCNKCHSEAACEWQRRNRELRERYQREYRAQ